MGACVTLSLRLPVGTPSVFSREMGFVLFDPLRMKCWVDFHSDFYHTGPQFMKYKVNNRAIRYMRWTKCTVLFLFVDLLRWKFSLNSDPSVFASIHTFVLFAMCVSFLGREIVGKNTRRWIYCPPMFWIGQEILFKCDPEDKNPLLSALVEKGLSESAISDKSLSFVPKFHLKRWLITKTKMKYKQWLHPCSTLALQPRQIMANSDLIYQEGKQQQLLLLKHCQVVVQRAL